MYIILSIYTKIHILNFYHIFEYILKNIYMQKTPLIKIYVFFIKIIIIFWPILDHIKIGPKNEGPKKGIFQATQK